MDKFKTFEILVRVAECGSFSGAADLLGVSNTTVTVAIRSLEERLKVRLLRRDSRRQTLTAEGEQVVARARSVLADVARLEASFQGQAAEPSGSLNIEVPVGFGQNVLAPALPRFMQRYPQISTTVALTNDPHNLTARGLDLAVRAGRVESEHYVVRPLFSSQYVLCGCPEVVASLPADPRDLDPRLCISMMPEESRHPMLWELTRGHEKAVIEPCGPVHFNNADAAVSVVRRYGGVTSILDLFASSHLADGVLVRAYPDWSMHRKSGYLVMPKDAAGTPKVRVFADFLRDLIPSANRPVGAREIPVMARLARPAAQH